MVRNRKEKHTETQRPTRQPSSLRFLLISSEDPPWRGDL